MDTAVALVQAYLQINGYFTVTEYPVLRESPDGGSRNVTDLDVLAFRFPQAGCTLDELDSSSAAPVISVATDPALATDSERADMLIGEVKEGHARFNPAVRDPRVIATALSRFGCCHPAHAAQVVDRLLARGTATTEDGHRVRLVAFGTAFRSRRDRRGLVVPLSHVVHFVRAHLERNWSFLGHAQFKHPVLGLLSLLEKAGLHTQSRRQSSGGAE